MKNKKKQLDLNDKSESRKWLQTDPNSHLSNEKQFEKSILCGQNKRDKENVANGRIHMERVIAQ